jgi:hypothetical protein
VGKIKDWLTGHVSTERTLEGEITATYTEKDKAEAPSGHMPLPGTDVEIVAYPVNEQDLVVLVNKGGVCVFRTILAGSLRSDLDLQKANFHMTEQRIVLGEPPESMKEMTRQMVTSNDKGAE